MAVSPPATQQPGTQGQEPAVVCACNLVCGKRVSQTSSNPGREFYACPRYSNDPGKCKFFAWVAPSQPNSLPSPPATPASSQVSSHTLATPSSQAAMPRRASPRRNIPNAVASSEAATSSTVLPQNPPSTPSSVMTPEQRAKRDRLINEVWSSGSSQPHPPSTPLSSRSNLTPEAKEKRLAIMQEALTPSHLPRQTEAGPSNYNPLPSIVPALEKVRSPSPPKVAPVVARKEPGSPLKRSYVEAQSDDEEYFWTAVDGNDGSRPSKAPRQDNTGYVGDHRQTAVPSAPALTPSATQTVDKGKGKERQYPPVVSDPENNPFETPSKADGGAMTEIIANDAVFTPSKSRADEFQASAQVMLQMVEYVRKLEQKQIAQEKSIDAKKIYIQRLEQEKEELQKEKYELQATNRRLEKIVECKLQKISPSLPNI